MCYDLGVLRNRPLKKRPSDYPQFIFRISADDKVQLTLSINQVKKIYNALKKEDEKVITKNEIIVNALKIGLKELIRNAKE